MIPTRTPRYEDTPWTTQDWENFFRGLRYVLMGISALCLLVSLGWGWTQALLASILLNLVVIQLAPRAR